jgi:lysophospholipase L1-like esterase
MTRIGKIALTAVLLLTALELGLQIRSQLRFGQSVLNAVRGETRYVEDMGTGLKLLRPNHVFPGQDVEIRSNSLGLRSPEILPDRTPGSLRIAVVGASTVMGELARNNEITFPALLAQRLRQRYPHREVEVVNAGISGYRLDDQQRMLRKIVLPLRPDLIIVYPGFNDFADYCQDPPDPSSAREGLPLFSAPTWLLSVEAVRRRTGFMRAAPPETKSVRDAAAIDVAPYRSRLESLIKTVREAHVPLLLATNARAYRNDQPLKEQLRLSEQARHFNRCFDLSGLHTLYDRQASRCCRCTRRSPADGATSSTPVTSRRTASGAPRTRSSVSSSAAAFSAPDRP